jgi:glycosyltransferase involved in cell wall biosynthesis
MLNHLTIAVRDDASPRCPHPTSPELSVLVPTRNEATNLEELLHRISTAVAGIPTEVVFLDDSDDATPDVIRTVARRGDGGTCQVSLLRRQGAQRTGGLAGLSSTASARPVHSGLVSSTRTFSIPPRPSRGCSPRRTAMGSTWWWLAGTASRDAPRARVGPLADLDRLHVCGEDAVPAAPWRRHRSDERVLPCPTGCRRPGRPPTPRVQNSARAACAVSCPPPSRSRLRVRHPSRRGEQGLGAGRPELPPVALRVALGSRTCSRPAVTGVPAVEPLVPLL